MRRVDFSAIFESEEEHREWMRYLELEHLTISAFIRRCIAEYVQEEREFFRSLKESR